MALVRRPWVTPCRAVAAHAGGTAPAPHHKHYETPADTTRRPRRHAAGAAAAEPRRPHVPGRHDGRARAAVHQPGRESRLRRSITPRRRARSPKRRGSIRRRDGYWGQALVLGPNINAPMTPDDEPKAFALAQKAVALKAKAIAARARLHRRGRGALHRPPEDRAKADKRLRRRDGAARRRVSRTISTRRTLYAEALMDLTPWNYWTRDGAAVRRHRQIIDVARDACWRATTNHPGALHLWIHLWEPTDTPERAEAEADRLLPLMPGAGHIVHMPAHIYQRVGRHADVIRVNQMAAKADEDYIAQCRAQGLYPLGYYPHNLHFIWMGATASGQKQLALESARKLAESGAARSARHRADPAGLPGRAVLGDGALRAVGRDSRRQGAAHETPFTRGVWHYARAMAFTATRSAGRGGARAGEARRRSSPIPAMKRADDVLDQQRVRDPAHRARSGGRRDRREAAGLGHGDPAPRARRALRGRARSIRSRTTGTRRCGRPRPRCCWRRAARTKPRRSLGGPEAEPGERLVAVACWQGAEGAGQGRTTRPVSRNRGVGRLRRTDDRRRQLCGTGASAWRRRAGSRAMDGERGVRLPSRAGPDDGVVVLMLHGNGDSSFSFSRCCH